MAQAFFSSQAGQANWFTGTFRTSSRLADSVEKAILSRSTANTPFSPASESPRDKPPQPANKSANIKGCPGAGNGGKFSFFMGSCPGSSMFRGRSVWSGS